MATRCQHKKKLFSLSLAVGQNKDRASPWQAIQRWGCLISKSDLSSTTKFDQYHIFDNYEFESWS